MKVMTNLGSMLKNRDITLPTKVRLVKAMVFLVVMYGCEKLPELINEFGQVAGQKINIEKAVVFLYMNNKLS